MNLPFDQIQREAKTLLAASPALAGITILLEDDPDATAEQLDAFEKTFEDTLAEKGFLLAIKTPHFRKQSEARRTAIAMHAVLLVVAFENPAVNRKTGGSGLTLGSALDAALLALLPLFGFEDEPLTPPARLDELHTRALVANLEIEREVLS